MSIRKKTWFRYISSRPDLTSNSHLSMIYLVFFLLNIFTFNNACHAESFLSLMEMARNNEPGYLSAKVMVQAAKARTDQAFGDLLPQVTMSVNTNHNDRNYETRSAGATPAQDQYNSHSTQLNLTQPIWRRPNIIGFQQTKSATSQAEQQLVNAEQELCAKVASVWLEFLSARDQILFTQQQLSSTKYRLLIAEHSFKLGSINQPELDDVQSKFDQANAENIAANTDLYLKRALLEQIVGNLNQLQPTFMVRNAKLINLDSENLESILARVEAGNHSILAAMYAQEAASAEVKKQYAGHQPTLDLVASYGKNSQAVGGFPGQAGYDIKQGTIGLQLNIPIYSGGTQSAKVSEAVAQSEKARLDLESARRGSILSAKQAWYGWYSAYAKMQSSKQAIKAASSALQAAQAAVNNGLKTEVATLEAQQQLSAAERDFNKNRYDQVLNYIKLKAIMGELAEDDIATLDTFFVNKPQIQQLEFNKFSLGSLNQ